MKKMPLWRIWLTRLRTRRWIWPKQSSMMLKKRLKSREIYLLKLRKRLKRRSKEEDSLKKRKD